MSNFVFVLDTNYQRLQPTHPAVARKLLKQNKAAIYRRYPFTIILKREVKPVTQPVQLKIDPGSKVTGFALVQGDKVIWGAQLTHRGQQIKRDLDSRRTIRRSRRNRKRRYRKPRFLNRNPSQGRLAPSLMHRVHTTITWVKRLIKLCPINGISQELVKFDLMKINNPDINGKEYQQGTRFSYEVREYLLEKWHRKCAYCNAENIPLEVEHIVPKSKLGSNRISNLTLACHRCNQKKGNQDLKDFLTGKPDLLKRILSQTKVPLKDAAAVNSTRWQLFHQLKLTGKPIETGSGGLTKYNRCQLNIPKSHYTDAACVGRVNSLTLLTNKPLLISCKGHGSRQYQRVNKYGFPSAKARQIYALEWKTGDIAKFVKAKGKNQGIYVGRVLISGKRNLEMRINKMRISGTPDKFTKLFSKDGYAYEF